MDFTLHYTPSSPEWDESIQEEIPAHSEIKKEISENSVKAEPGKLYLHLHTSLTPGDIMIS